MVLFSWLVRWACRACTRDFCFALVGPVMFVPGMCRREAGRRTLWEGLMTSLN